MQNRDQIQIFIIDDHPMVIEGLRSLLSQLDFVQVTGTADNGDHAMKWLKENSADLVLLDINLPDVSGVELCKTIKDKYPDIKILGISTFSDRSYISRMIANGASGYMIKNASSVEIAEAIRVVMSGKLYMNLDMEYLLRPSPVAGSGADIPELTKREKEILGYIADGYTNNKIAEKLFISPSTVDTHRKNLLTKLNVNNTAALIRLAVEKGLF